MPAALCVVAARERGPCRRPRVRVARRRLRRVQLARGPPGREQEDLSISSFCFLSLSFSSPGVARGGGGAGSAVVTVRGRAQQQQRVLVVALRTASAAAPEGTQTRRLRTESRPLGVSSSSAAAARRQSPGLGARRRQAPFALVVRGGVGGRLLPWRRRRRRSQFPATVVVLAVPVGDVELLQRRLDTQLVFAKHRSLVDLLQFILRGLKRGEIEG